MADSNQERERQEEAAASRPVPILFIVGFFLLGYISTLYLDSRAGGFHPRVHAPFDSHRMVRDLQPRSNLDPRFERGRLAYNTYCAACHQTGGKGAPGQFPPLAGSDWVDTESPARLIRVVMNGLAGPITVSGREWNLSTQMLAWKDVITDDEELAALLTYVRGQEEWGNSAAPVTVEQVREIRSQVASRTTPWTQEELLAAPDLPSP